VHISHPVKKCLTVLRINQNVIPKYGTDIVIGCGGGKVLDMAKGAGDRAGQRVITVPSSAATFNCWSALSVMYYPNGKPLNLFWHDHEVDCAIVDTKLLSEAPARLFASGVADSFAKYYEGNLCNEANTIFTLTGPQYSAKVISGACNETLLNFGEAAYRDNQKHEVTDAYEKCIHAVMANAAMSGGLSGGYIVGGAKPIVSFAHNTYDMIRRVFTEEAKGALHGEIIGLVLYAQLFHMGRPEYEIKSFRRFLDALDQPKSLRDIGIDPTDENLNKLVDEIMVWGSHPEEHRQVIWDGLQIIKG